MTASGRAAWTPGLLWEGSFFVHHSLANVNCEMAAALARSGVELGLMPYEPPQFAHGVDPRYAPIAERLGRMPAIVDAHVRHQWPPNFRRPQRGRFVLLQPWEFGSLPIRWVERIESGVDEVWVPSTWVRDVYVSSGVDPDTVFVIPQGVDPAVFNPSAPPRRLRTSKTFRFLFVGGSLERKGFDLLLDAYARTFSSNDDVCLVIKDFFYGAGEGRAAVRALRRRRRAPAVEYSYGNWPARALAGLYTACHCYVHPYRGEGFALPIAEAMACGLPAIVTGSGPVLDYCARGTAYLVPAEVQPVPGGWDRRFATVRPPTWFEPDLKALCDAMRQVFEEYDVARRRGAKGSAHIRRRFTWDHSATAVLARLRAWHS